MKLAVIGGGGFRVPLLVQALAGSPFNVHLYDDDADRMEVIRAVISQMDVPQPVIHDNLASALSGSDYVFTAIRVGGTEARALDEEIALRHGFLGQETVGLGGIAFALRTIPVARKLAAAISSYAPNAWTLNFTNPVGVVTQAMQEILGDWVIGICDTPISLVNRVAGERPITSIDYVGLNHLGWLRSLMSEDTDLVTELLSDDKALAGLDEAKVFGAETLRSIGALPNEYLFYYWFTRDAIHRITTSQGRGSYLATQQGSFYRAALEHPENAYELWSTTLADREETYGSETREDHSSRRSSHEIAVGGYQAVALTLLSALSGGSPALTISNVRNEFRGKRSLAQLPDGVVIEIPCIVDSTGVQRLPVKTVPSEFAGLMVQVTGSDKLILAATSAKDPLLAVRALAAHPLIDSLSAAQAALDEYCSRIPSMADAIGWEHPTRTTD